jgi:hypothetical protein
MNDNHQLQIGERVRRRDMPWVEGTVWDIFEGQPVIEWDDGDENAYPPWGRIERITPASRPRLVHHSSS